jgi:cell division septum initiation protein DivIVA
MWFIPTKKEVKKEFEKIKDSFKERDERIEKLKEKIEAHSLKIATLEGSYLVLSQSQKSQSQGSLRQSQSKIETKLIQRIRNNKKALVMAEIVKLRDSHTAQEIFEKIVKERGLCSKASFYRYLSSLKSQNLIETETKVRLKSK